MVEILTFDSFDALVLYYQEKKVHLTISRYAILVIRKWLKHVQRKWQEKKIPTRYQDTASIERIAVNADFRFLNQCFCVKNRRRKSVIFGDDFKCYG